MPIRQLSLCTAAIKLRFSYTNNTNITQKITLNNLTSMYVELNTQLPKCKLHAARLFHETYQFYFISVLFWTLRPRYYEQPQRDFSLVTQLLSIRFGDVMYQPEYNRSTHLPLNFACFSNSFACLCQV